MKCPSCGVDLPDGSKFCDNCGNKIQIAPSGKKCPQCGFENMSQAAFCDNCGYQFVSATSPPPPPPPYQPSPVVTPSAAPPAPISTPSPFVGQMITCPNCNTQNPAGTIYCNNCGKNLAAAAAPPTIKYKLELENGTVLEYDSGKKVGRADFGSYLSNEESNWISREHFVIAYKDDKFYISDKESTNGTKLNNISITGQGEKELQEGDLIILADLIKLTFKK